MDRTVYINTCIKHKQRVCLLFCGLGTGPRLSSQMLWGTASPKPPEDMKEPSHGRVFRKKDRSVCVVKGVWSLLTDLFFNRCLLLCMDSCTCDFSFSYLDMTSFNISLCSSSLSAILWLNVTGAVFCAECATLKALPSREFNSSSWKADQNKLLAQWIFNQSVIGDVKCCYVKEDITWICTTCIHQLATASLTLKCDQLRGSKSNAGELDQAWSTGYA